MRATCVALLVALAAGSCVAPIDQRGFGEARADRADQRIVSERRQLDALLARINRRRIAIGCRALTWDDRLASVARRHSADMVRRDFFSHTNPDGDDPFDRMRKAGIRYRNAAENLAEGQRTAEETYRAWRESPGHRRNMENCVYTRAGLGLVRNRWTLVLARPAGTGS